MIGYYVHHSGNGHRTRAQSICARMDRPVTVLTSLPVPESGVFERTIRLPRDDTGHVSDGSTAHGALHWVPLQDNGLRDRMALIAEWIGTTRPAAMVVDVSVEVAVLARLMGVPVVVMAMPGQRTDEPHDLVYKLADHIIACWPDDLYEPAWLRAHRHKTSYVGGISRFDGRVRGAARLQERPRVLVFGGGADIATGVQMCAAQLPQFQWTALGVGGGAWTEDPWPDLVAADVVVAHAGEGSVADIAVAERPAIIIPQHRPFAEQHTTARVLEESRLAVVRARWPQTSEWPRLLERAGTVDVRRWRKWRCAAAADRAAAVIERVASRSVAGALR